MQLPSLVIASHNQGKVREIKALLSPFVTDVKGASDFNLDEPEETENSFIGNADLKALYVMKRTDMPALADDSGLVVPALDGAPGIYSARWGGEAKDFNIAMARVEQELVDKGVDPEGQEAYFACALSLAVPGQDIIHVEGRVYGALSFPPRGDRGFGYDPIFIAKGETQTFAEMDPEVKQAMSHRADAFRQLIDVLNG